MKNALIISSINLLGVVLLVLAIVVIQQQQRLTFLEDRTQFLFEQCEEHFCSPEPMIMGEKYPDWADQGDYYSELHHCSD